MNTTRLAVPLLAGAILTVASTGTGYAYWRTSGSGAGAAVTGTAVTLDTPGTATAGQLFPGSTLTGSITVTNRNPFPVAVNRVTFGAVSVANAQGTCANTGVSFASGATSVAVPAGQSRSVPYTVTMTGSSDNGCQGATFTAPYTLEAVSS